MLRVKHTYAFFSSFLGFFAARLSVSAAVAVIVMLAGHHTRVLKVSGQLQVKHHTLQFKIIELTG